MGENLAAVPAISARIAQIRSLVADPALAVAAAGSGQATTGTAAGTSESGAAFEAALAEALGEAGGSTAASSGLVSGLASSSGVSSSLASSLASSLGSSSGLSSGYSALLLGLSGLGSSGSSSLASSGLDLSALAAVLGVGSASGATTSGTTTSTAATAATGGGLNADGVPADLAAYGNGRIPESALAPVEGSSERLWAPAADALNRLIDAAAADGVTIGVTDGYRSYDAQEELVQTKGLYSAGGLAAAPGTSEHGWGMAADLKLDSNALAWMRANAGSYGFVESTPRESWHWSYHPES